jgi:hypothetical protein
VRSGQSRWWRLWFILGQSFPSEKEDEPQQYDTDKNNHFFKGVEKFLNIPFDLENTTFEKHYKKN